MLTPDQITEAFYAIGKKKTSLPIPKMLGLGILAGIFIALAGVGATQMSALLGGGIGKIAGAMVFPAGLVMVVLAGSELFTGNCLITVSVLEKQTPLRGMLKNWLFVYIGNFLGSLLIAAAVSLWGGISTEAFAQAAVSTAVGKVTLSFSAAFVRGILCNILVCIAVWIAAAADSVGGKIAGVYFPIMLFVLCGFEHSVANMYYLPAGLFYADRFGISAEGLTVGSALWNNLLPVTLGNLIGGGLCVGTLYWALYRKKKTQTKMV